VREKAQYVAKLKKLNEGGKELAELLTSPADTPSTLALVEEGSDEDDALVTGAGPAWVCTFDTKLVASAPNTYRVAYCLLVI